MNLERNPIIKGKDAIRFKLKSLNPDKLTKAEKEKINNNYHILNRIANF